MRVDLQPHPAASLAGAAVEAEAGREGETLRLRYRLTGALDRIRLPEPDDPVRTDGLWRHSCFEAFVKPDGASSYYELNFAASGRWAAYWLGGYRTGMTEAPVPPPLVSPRRLEGTFELEATLDLSSLPDLSGAPWRLGLAAVLEAADGGLSYWAIAHPPGDPDFHHEAGFARRL